jgi:acetolactate synthase-1/2/3 large subunit
VTTIRVADFIAGWFADVVGARKVFLVTGAGSMHLSDGVAKHPQLDAVCLHHEQSVSMAVEAYSRVSGEMGVAYVSTGPAATNTVTGLAGAWQDSVACFFVSGQVKVSETSAASGVDSLRQFGVQELNILPVVQSLTKYAATVSKPTDILFHLQAARHHALDGRPGPVWLEIPMDVQSAFVNPETLEEFVPTPSSQLPGKGTELAQAFVRELAKSNRPVILVGQGVRLSDCVARVGDFARAHGIPVVSSYLGADSYLPHDKNFIGKIGVKGERAANIVVQKSDLLLVLGSSLHVSSIGYNYNEFAPGARKWIVDVDVTSHKKKTLTDFAFVEASIADFLDTVEGGLASEPLSPWTQWSEVAADLAQRFPTCSPEYRDDKEGINIYQVVEEACQVIGPGDVVVSDAGSAFYAVTQGVRLSDSTQRYLTSGAMATMGYSLPAAIGVAYARPDSRVFAFTGDGSLHQNIQELGQMKFLNLPIVLIVLNNAGYLSIRASQVNYFDKRFIGTDDQSGLGLPDISEISRAYGLETFTIVSLDSLAETLKSVSKQRTPVVLDVRTPRDQLIIPTVSSRLTESGSMVSRSLHDMTPLLSEDLLQRIMNPAWGFVAETRG